MTILRSLIGNDLIGERSLKGILQTSVLMNCVTLESIRTSLLVAFSFDLKKVMRGYPYWSRQKKSGRAKGRSCQGVKKKI
jgi:hypothetical protein